MPSLSQTGCSPCLCNKDNGAKISEELHVDLALGLNGFGLSAGLTAYTSALFWVSLCH